MKTTQRTLAAVAWLAVCCTVQPSPVQAAAVSAAARAAYNAGLAAKTANPARALRDFAHAAALAPTWEAPVYQEGVLLSVSDFARSIPVLLLALKLNPTDDTVWNILGWGYYVHKDFRQAADAFRRQLVVRPNSPNALWGLANCDANNLVRAYAKARLILTRLRGNPQFHAAAAKLLAVLPPAALDATVHPTAPVTYEDAIGMLLLYRSDVRLTTRTTLAAADGRPASADLQPYVAWASARGLLAGLTIPSFAAPATRLFIARLMARYYGVNAYDYVRPFPLTDMQGQTPDNVMVVNSVLALRLMQETAPNQFAPNGTVTRYALSTLVSHANAVMKNPVAVSQLLTPPAPPSQHHPTVYFFTTSQPTAAVQNADIALHKSELTDIGLTSYPLIQDAPPQAALTRQKQDGTSYILTALSASPSTVQQLALTQAAGIHPYLVLGNYNQVTQTSDPVTVHRLLSSATSRSGLAAEVVRVAVAEHLGGITVDFENMDPTDGQNYVRFLAQLRAVLTSTQGANQMKLMVCLPERSQDNAASPYDYAGLAASADQVMLITYDEHTPGSKPGPISQLANDDRVVKYALTAMPAAKILLGIGAFGYDWTSAGHAEEVSMQQAQQLASSHQATIHVDPLSQAPTFQYTDAAGVVHTVWFNDEASVAKQMALVNQYGLGGLAVWHLGAEDDQFWTALRSTFIN